MKTIHTFHSFIAVIISVFSFTYTASATVNGEPANVYLSGKITDAKTGNPLAGAIIYIHETKTGTVSDANGNYKTPLLPAGKYLVEISFLGYTSVLETVDISNNNTKNFALKVTYIENEAVTVTGVASATKVKQSAQPVSIVKRSELLQTSSTNIIDAIGKVVPGVSGLSTGPAISKPVIRGLGYNRVVTVHDGVRQEGQQWGDEHGIEVDEYSIQKVEVLKGPASLFYGSDAMAGVVHLITNVPVESGTVKANLLAVYTDNNGLLGTNASIAGHLKNGFNWNVYGTSKSVGDYRNAYDGKVFNSRFNEKNIGGYIGLNKSWGYSHLLISHFHQQLGVIEGSRDSATGKFLVFSGTPMEHIATQQEFDSRDMLTPYQQIDHFKIASDNNFSIGKNRLAVNIGFQQNSRREFGDPVSPKTPDLYFDLKTLNYSLQYNLAENNGWKTSLGATGMWQSNSNLADRVLIPAYNLFDGGVFVYTKKSFTEKFTLSGGIRADTRNVQGKAYSEAGISRFAAFNRNFGNISGSMGAGYSLNEEVTLKLNIARGYRAPSVSELASNGAHEGTNRYEYGDQNLGTETSFQADAGVEVNKQHFSFALNAFYNYIGNYIFYSKLASVKGGDSLVTVGTDQIEAFKFRQAAATLVGFEVRFDLHPHPLDWLHFENSFSYVAGHFNQFFESSNKLPFIPAPKLQSELRGDFKKAGKDFRNFYVKLEMDKTFSQERIFSAYQTETITPAYTLFNVGTGTDIMSRGKVLCSIHLSFNNITDVAYQNHLSRLKYTDVNNVTGRQGVFNMGRSFTMKLNVPLEWKL